MKVEPALAAASLLLLAGCSPYLYGTELTAFADSIEITKTAQATMTAALPQAENQSLLERSRETRPRFVLDEIACLDRRSTTRCTAVPAQLTQSAASATAAGKQTLQEQAVAETQTTPVAAPADLKPLPPAPSWCSAPQPFVPSKSPRPDIRPGDMLVALENYSKALAAISNAKDREEFDAASTALATSSVALVGLFIGGPQGAAVTAIVAAVIELARYTEAVSLDVRRYRVLRCVVVRSQEAVAVLGTLIGADLDLQAAGLRSVYLGSARAVSRAMATPRPAADWNASVTRMQTLASSIDGLNRVHGVATAAAMTDAHRKLAEALQTDERRQLGAVAAAVSSFADKAGTLQKAVSAIP